MLPEEKYALEDLFNRQMNLMSPYIKSSTAKREVSDYLRDSLGLSPFGTIGGRSKHSRARRSRARRSRARHSRKQTRKTNRRH